MTDIYAPDEVIGLIADIFPASITPLPPGVPTGQWLRVVVTERALTVLWQGADGDTIGRADFPMTVEDTATASFQGGQVGQYTIQRNGGCGCGVGRKLKVFQPWPGHQYNSLTRPTASGQIYGVPPARQPTRWVRA